MCSISPEGHVKGTTFQTEGKSLVVSAQWRQDLILCSLCLALIQISKGKHSLHLLQSIADRSLGSVTGSRKHYTTVISCDSW